MIRHVEAFLLHRESEGRSPKTLATHRNNLTEFVAWATEKNIALPTELTVKAIREYVIYLQRRTAKNGDRLKPSSVRCYVNSVLAFLRWLHDEELMDKNLAEKISPPKIPTLVKEPFAADDLKRLVAAAKADKRNGLREHALILFMLDTGARASEVVGLKTADIVWNQGMAKVMGKGSKERVLFLSTETMKAMRKYTLSHDHELFFSTEEGKPLTPSGLLQICSRLGKRADVGNCHPHRFRHTFALSFLRNGGNVLALQRMLGHTTLLMTQRYVALVSDDLQREHVRFSPVTAFLK